MISLSKYRFRTRLLLGFSLIIVLNIISVGVSLSKITDTQNDLKLMFEHPFVVSSDARTIEAEASNIHHKMKRLAQSKNDEEIFALLKDVSKSDSIIKLSYKNISKFYLGNLKDVNKSQEIYLEWGSVRKEVIALTKKGNLIKAFEITRTKDDEFIDLLAAKNQVLIDFVNNKANQLYTDNLNKEKEAAQLLTLLMVSLAFLSIFIVLIISKSITKPINVLVSKLRKYKSLPIVSSQNSDQLTEQEMLELAVNQLEASHRKIKGFNKKLKLKVAEKTKSLSETNQSLQDMVYIASHDLQVPLISMEGYTDELLKNYKDCLDENGIYCLTRLHANSKRMHKLVLSLLDISRLNTHINPYEKFDANAVIDTIVRDLTLVIEAAGAKITCGKLPNIYADKQRVESVFRNLIQNAINYEGKHIEIGFKEDIFFVKDDGMGIPPDQLSRIFEPGERLKYNKAEGVGMGLTFCKKTISLHNGSIWAASEGKDKGSVFYIKFNQNNINPQS